MSVRQGQTQRVYRWLQCLTAMQGGGAFTARELARRYGTNPRTIYRDLVALQEMHFPLTSENGRWSLMETFRLPPVQFTPEEAAALARGLDWVGRNQALGGPAALTAMDKLKVAMPEPLRRLVNEWEASLVVDPLLARSVPGPAGIEELLRAAVLQRSKVRIDYHSLSGDAFTRRVIHPYGLAYRGVGLYVIGYCELRRDRRTFRVARIGHAEALPEPFTPPRNFDLDGHLQSVWGIEDGPVMAVTLRFNRAVAPLARETTWHPTQRVQEQPDGSVLLQMETRGRGELARWIAQFGGEVAVIQPVDLADAVRAIAQGLLRVYVDKGRVVAL